MDKEIITAENGLYSHSNITYSSGHRIAWIYITNFRTATEAAVCNVHTQNLLRCLPSLFLIILLFFITRSLCHPLHNVSIALSISM